MQNPAPADRVIICDRTILSCQKFLRLADEFSELTRWIAENADKAKECAPLLHLDELRNFEKHIRNSAIPVPASSLLSNQPSWLYPEIRREREEKCKRFEVLLSELYASLRASLDSAAKQLAKTPSINLMPMSAVLSGDFEKFNDAVASVKKVLDAAYAEKKHLMAPRPRASGDKHGADLYSSGHDRSVGEWIENLTLRQIGECIGCAGRRREIIKRLEKTGLDQTSRERWSVRTTWPDGENERAGGISMNWIDALLKADKQNRRSSR